MTMDRYEFLSTLEKKVFRWLTKKKILFSTQEKMFGIGEIGSATIDFIVPERNLAIRIMGSYWHSSFESKARDLLGKEQLFQAGYEVVDVWEADLADNKIDRTLELALQGVEIPK